MHKMNVQLAIHRFQHVVESMQQRTEAAVRARGLTTQCGVPYKVLSECIRKISLSASLSMSLPQLKCTCQCSA